MRMSYKIQTNIPMALSGGAGVEELVGGAPNFSSLSVMVDVEPDLEKMEGGPKWVSFNSVVEVLVAVFLWICILRDAFPWSHEADKHW